MKARTKPKIWAKKIIYKNYKEIGSINMVNYLTKESIPHLEFRLDEEYQGQGIMTKEVAKYLKERKKYNKHTRLLAVAKKDNIASQRVLEKNNFIKFTEMKEKFIYGIDLNFTKEQVNKAIEIVNKEFSLST